jgi:hypothetical protein
VDRETEVDYGCGEAVPPLVVCAKRFCYLMLNVSLMLPGTRICERASRLQPAYLESATLIAPIRAFRIDFSIACRACSQKNTRTVDAGSGCEYP